MNARPKLAAFAVVLVSALGGAWPSATPSARSTRRRRAGARTRSTRRARRARPQRPTPEPATPTSVVATGRRPPTAHTVAADTAARRTGRPSPSRSGSSAPTATVVDRLRDRHERGAAPDRRRQRPSAYAHLHPDGPPTAPGASPRRLAPGVYRAGRRLRRAGGPELTLGGDLTVPGRRRRRPAPPAGRDRRGRRLRGHPRRRPGAGVRDAELAFTVTRDGEPVTDLEPYLGACGHLVAHPRRRPRLPPRPPDGRRRRRPDARRARRCRFAVEVPSPGTYRLFLDFPHDGEVRTAAFTVEVPRTAAPADASTPTSPTRAHGATDDGTADPARRQRSTCDRRHDLRVVRRPDREAAQPARRRHRHGQLRHRAGHASASPATVSTRRPRRRRSRPPATRAQPRRRRPPAPATPSPTAADAEPTTRRPRRCATGSLVSTALAVPVVVAGHGPGAAVRRTGSGSR